jgi:O-antigen/teichoic acid export membrane protein
MTLQGTTLLCNLVFGLLCVRLIAPVDYAKFVVLFGVQGTLSILMDLNLSGTLVPIIGERIHDRQLIADYIASMRVVARRVYYIVGLGLIFAYPLLVRRQHWTWRLVAGMVVTLLISTWFIRINSIYGAVLILARQRQVWAYGQMLSSLSSLLLLGLLWKLGGLSAFTAIMSNVMGIVLCAGFYYRQARLSLGVPGVATPAKCKSLIRLALPNVPQSLFYAFQGSISLFIITLFGRATSIASIGALARLGQLFTLFLQLYPILVEPYFAKLPKNRLKLNYIVGLAITATVCLAVALMVSYFSGFFLAILGPGYRGLTFELKLAISAAAISSFSGVLWSIHGARRFVYWWSTILGISSTLVVQVCFIARADLSSIRTVLWLNIATNITSLAVNACCGAYGFIKGPREVEDPAPAIPPLSAAEAAEEGAF